MAKIYPPVHNLLSCLRRPESPYLNLVLCTVLMVVLALTSHILIFEWTKPLLAQMTEGLPSPFPNGYPRHIMYAAYGTAFIQGGLIVFMYYHAGHLLPVPHRFLRSLLLAGILLESKGELFRQPFMDYLCNVTLGLKTPLLFVLLKQADKWVANLFLAFCLVYFCSTKVKNHYERRITSP